MLDAQYKRTDRLALVQSKQEEWFRSSPSSQQTKDGLKTAWFESLRSPSTEILINTAIHRGAGQPA